MWLFRGKEFGAKETISLNMTYSGNGKKFTVTGDQ